MRTESHHLGFSLVKRHFQVLVLLFSYCKCFPSFYSLLHLQHQRSLLRIRRACLYLLRWPFRHVPSSHLPNFRSTLRPSNIRYLVLRLPSVELYPILAGKLCGARLFCDIQDQWSHEYMRPTDGEAH